MKIGIFDSGLGGLVITKSFLSNLPQYDYCYFGDTKNLPYGDKAGEDVLKYTIEAIRFLVEKDCKLIIIACNTATSIALRYLQQVYVPQNFPDIKILGVVVPTVEEAIDATAKSIGVVATKSTVSSHIYKIEIEKINPNIDVFELETPKLVPAIEENNLEKAEELVKIYAEMLPSHIESLILGCTHYPMLKDFFKKYLPDVNIISQDDFIYVKLEDYLKRHQEIDILLEKNNKREFYFSKVEEGYKKIVENIIGKVEIHKI